MRKFVSAVFLLALPAMLIAQSGAFIRSQSFRVSVPPLLITAGPDGAMWFTTNYNIGSVTTAGVITQYTVPTPGSSPYGITAGPDGAVWFTETDANQIGRSTTSGLITEYPIPTAGSFPVGITAGPDGALWFTEEDGGKIGRITTSGAFTEYLVPTPDSGPFWIIPGPDGALWFTEVFGNKIGRITTSGAITEYPIPPNNTGPHFMALGSDGALWFTEDQTKIGRITIDGVINYYPLTDLSAPWAIGAGPDGALWFTGYGITRITTSGVVTIYPAATDTFGVAAGPDGAIWFTLDAPNGFNRVPACGLGFSASFADDTLSMKYDLGIDTSATFDVAVRNAEGSIGQPFSEAIGPVVPPQARTVEWPNFPYAGTVTIESTLKSAPGQVLCSEWTTVNTAP